MIGLSFVKNSELPTAFKRAGLVGALAILSLQLGSCASVIAPETPPATASSASINATETLPAVTASAELASLSIPAPSLPSFEVWLAEFRSEALAAGIRAATLDAAFAGVKPIERVIELDRQQPESVLTFEDYLTRVVPERRVAIGRERLAQHRALLNKVSAEFNVPARFIVALWGIETDYGRLGGNFSVVASLATLAYEGRRAALFRSQLLDALRILESGDVALSDLRGSWAGAMGQTQFMPSTFRNYAVDFNGDGKRDPWNQPADVFASAANYLSKIGWVKGETWGREVRVPDNFDRQWLGLEQRKTLAEWQALGVRRKDGADLAAFEMNASLVQPSGPGGRAFLAYDNFRVLMQWNRSTYFGVAVGQLADALAEGEN
jgi:membrane-bound lytic murein transglycosylase B